MARGKYIISKDDYPFAKRWVQKLITDILRAGRLSVKETIQAENEFDDIGRSAKKLNAWCEQYLDSGHWKKMKNSVRAARKRRLDKISTTGGKKSLDIDIDAWTKLSTIAEAESLTYSAVLNKYLKKSFLKVLGGDDKLQQNLSFKQ